MEAWEQVVWHQLVSVADLWASLLASSSLWSPVGSLVDAHPSSGIGRGGRGWRVLACLSDPAHCWCPPSGPQFAPRPHGMDIGPQDCFCDGSFEGQVGARPGSVPSTLPASSATRARAGQAVCMLPFWLPLPRAAPTLWLEVAPGEVFIPRAWPTLSFTSQNVLGLGVRAQRLP